MNFFWDNTFRHVFGLKINLSTKSFKNFHWRIWKLKKTIVSNILSNKLCKIFFLFLECLPVLINDVKLYEKLGIESLEVSWNIFFKFLKGIWSILQDFKCKSILNKLNLSKWVVLWSVFFIAVILLIPSFFVIS